MKHPSRWWNRRLNSSTWRWVKLRDPTDWHDGWGEADEMAARYYRRLVAYCVGEARRQARRARDAEARTHSVRWFLDLPLEKFTDLDEDIRAGVNERFWELL